MKITKKDIFFIHILLLINIINCNLKRPLFKCEHSIEDEMNPLPNYVDENPIKDKGEQKRRINDADNQVDEEGFRNFNIYLDLENIKKEINDNGLSAHEEFFTSSMEKAVEILKSLLKVRPLQKEYYFPNESFVELNIHAWNKEIFGTQAYENGKNFKNQNIDLAIFGKLADLGDLTLAKASARCYQNFTTESGEVLTTGPGNGQPYVGVVQINKNINYNLPNSKEYFITILVHEFTHILGFSSHFFKNIYHNIVQKPDSNGINRTYLNSQKLLEVARKYFNCSTLDGVELEDQGGDGTESSHWESRILLGEYMNGYAYSEEMVISEFTLAVLEDSGFYKANYYTGGLMRYGKHKGCEFLNQKCIDPVTHKTNEKFENEFFDSLTNSFEAACSSGRQTRAYKFYYKLDNLNTVDERYRYYENELATGYEPADYCPVPQKNKEEEDQAYFSGHCSSIGKGYYGKILYPYITNYDTSSSGLAQATGEILGDHSFCFLSSLMKSSQDELISSLSSVVRANCYEISCSPQSLTLKIFDDYIVCPRAGGKIQVEGYEGYLLCPDYNLMCSGTEICNNIIDCVTKGSKIKDPSYTYEYEINTSQNIGKSKDAPFSTDNYELTTEGICSQNCKQCKENNICVKCRDDYELVLEENTENNIVKCYLATDLAEGYFKDVTTNIYQKCMDNCLKCSDKSSCQKCQTGYRYKGNKCVVSDNAATIIANCLEYDEDDSCLKCEENYGFKENNRAQCLNVETDFVGYYSRDNKHFYPCSNSNVNCSKCYYNKTILDVVCQECINDLILLDKNKGICKTKVEIENDKGAYLINDTHAGLCSKAFNNCLFCDNDTTCTKCFYGYKFVEKDNDENEIRKCINKSEVNKIVYGETGSIANSKEESSSKSTNSRKKRKKNSSNYFSIINIFVLQTVYIILLLINF